VRFRLDEPAYVTLVIERTAAVEPDSTGEQLDKAADKQHYTGQARFDNVQIDVRLAGPKNDVAVGVATAKGWATWASAWTFLIQPHDVAGRIPECCNPFVSGRNLTRGLHDLAPVGLDARQNVVDVVNPDIRQKSGLA
jgi:hypothetical protein